MRQGDDNPDLGNGRKQIDVMVVFDLKELRYHTILRNLFAHPKLALGLLCVKPFVFKSVLTMVVLCVAGGLAMASLHRGFGKEEVRKGVEFFHDAVGDTRMIDGHLAWQEPTPRQLPVSLELGRFQLTVTDAKDVDGIKQSVSMGGSYVRNGMVISPERVLCWSAGADDVGQTVWQELPLLNRLKGADGVEQFLLNRDSIPEYVTIFSGALFIANWAIESTALLIEWLVWCALMSIMAVFMGLGIFAVSFCLHRNTIRIPLWRRLQLAVSYSANLTLIPLLAALIYSGAGYGSPSSLVGIMFIVYMAYAIIEGRNGRVSLRA